MPELFQVPKRCRCGSEWTGNSFHALHPDEVLPRAATCAVCLAKEEERTQALYSRPVETIPDVELVPPQAAGEIT